MVTQSSAIGRQVAQGEVRPGTYDADINVGDSERWLSAVGGGLLACYGLTRGSVSGLALAAVGGSLLYRGLTGHCHAYEAMGIDTSGQNPATSVEAGHGVKVERAITINRPVEEVYRFWRNFENLSKFMDHLESVKVLDGGRSHWVAKGPLGFSAEWDAEVINERPNELIAWRSLEGSSVETAGSVHFRRTPSGRNTEVRVVLKYNPPAGKVGVAVARLFGQEPNAQIAESLRKLKEVLEGGAAGTVGAVGVTPTTAGVPASLRR